MACSHAATNACEPPNMYRSISPPPAKRQRIGIVIPPQTTSPAVHAALPPIESSAMRIVSWNVNGIAPFLQKPMTSFFQSSRPKPSNSQEAKIKVPPASLRAFLHRHSWPAMLFLQEVKIAIKDLKTQEAVRAAVNSRLPLERDCDNKGPIYEAHFILPNDPHNAGGLRGNGNIYGVCSIVRSDLCKNYNLGVRTVDWDNEGRISVVECGSKAAKLAIFNIYAVNGTDNPYRDPLTGTIRGTRHERKLDIHRMLMQECLELENAGWYVLLAGDMNVAPDARDGHPKLRTFPQQHVLSRVDFHEKLLGDSCGRTRGFNGIDIWREMHGEERRYTYFSRGREWGTSCDRVDYFIAGRRLWNRGLVKDCGILDSEAERGPSDHVPIWAEIHFE